MWKNTNQTYNGEMSREKTHIRGNRSRGPFVIILTFFVCLNFYVTCIINNQYKF